MAFVLILALCLSACSSNDENEIYMEIHDSVADIEALDDGTARLFVCGVITNNSKTLSAEYDLLPKLTIDGEVMEAGYEPLGDPDVSDLPPGASVYYEVTYNFDPTVDHEWKFTNEDGTVVYGLEEYACIKAALRALEDKPAVTMADIRQMEKEQKQRYKEFLKEEAENKQ